MEANGLSYQRSEVLTVGQRECAPPLVRRDAMEMRQHFRRPVSVCLIAPLQRGVGRMRYGLDVVMAVLSGNSGSKMADVAAVGSVLVSAASKSGQKPRDAVAVLAASAVMAETIPPCINVIILGFVANLSIGGLFMAGLVPSALMAAAHGGWLFLLLSIAILIVMGSVLEGAAPSIIFGPLLMRVARQIGIDPQDATASLRLTGY